MPLSFSSQRQNYIDVATGSLGQGLSIAAGMAYCGKYYDKARYMKIYYMDKNRLEIEKKRVRKRERSFLLPSLHFIIPSLPPSLPFFSLTLATVSTV